MRLCGVHRDRASRKHDELQAGYKVMATDVECVGRIAGLSPAKMTSSGDSLFQQPPSESFGEMSWLVAGVAAFSDSADAACKCSINGHHGSRYAG